jgi:hypothetical protein
MIPLYLFLAAWLVLLVIYGFVAFISIVQMVRFGLASSMTYFSTGIFLFVAGIVLAGTTIYLATVDWSLALDVTSIFGGTSAIPF